MAAIGLSLIFGTTGLVNFAHAELVTLGMLSTYFFNFYGFAGLIGFLAPLAGAVRAWRQPDLAAILGMIAGGLLGCVLNRFIFRRRARRREPDRAAGHDDRLVDLPALLFLYIFRRRPAHFG